MIACADFIVVAWTWGTFLATIVIPGIATDVASRDKSRLNSLEYRSDNLSISRNDTMVARLVFTIIYHGITKDFGSNLMRSEACIMTKNCVVDTARFLLKSMRSSAIRYSRVMRRTRLGGYW